MKIKYNTILYRFIAQTGVWLIAFAEFVIHHTSAPKRFFNPDDFDWIGDVERNAKVLIREMNHVMEEYQTIPELKDLSAEQKRIVTGNRWKSFFFYAYGKKIEKNCALCPATIQTLNTIPGMVTAFYSILEPQTFITEHRGPYSGVLRYHLALKVPEKSELCAIRMENEIRNWEQGASLVFDDSYLHEAWNKSSEIRVVLFVDFIRPLPFPVSLMNKSIIWLMSQSPFINNITDKA